MSILTPFRCPAGSGLLCTMSSPSLLWSCSTKQAAGIGAGLKLGEHAKAVTGNQLEYRAVSVCFLCLCFGSKQTCMHSSQAKSRLLQPFCQSHWFSDQLRGLTLTPQGGYPSSSKLLLFLVSPLGSAGPRVISPFPLYWILVIPIYSLGSVSLSTRLQFIFSESCSTCRCMFDLFVRGRWFQHPLMVPSWSS